MKTNKKGCHTAVLKDAKAVELPINKLKPYPDQLAFFPTTNEFEFEALKNDIRANGMQQPIDVMPPKNVAGLDPNTIISGHTRWRIQGELGHKNVAVKIRYDLVNYTRAEVDKEFLLANAARRQLSPLSLARAAKRIYDIELDRRNRRMLGSSFQEEDLRDQIGKIFRRSGRNLQRYFNLLETPIEVQNAHETGLITLVDGDRISHLSEEQQEQLAARLRAGEKPSDFLEEFLPKKCRQHVKVGDAVASFVRSLDTHLADLGHRVEKVRHGHVRDSETTIRKGHELLCRFVELLDSLPEPETLEQKFGNLKSIKEFQAVYPRRNGSTMAASDTQP